jgi:hypothetical protein
VVPPGPQLWAIGVETLLPPPGPGLVESVEALIRIVTPEALGANGTPPPEHIAQRLR